MLHPAAYGAAPTYLGGAAMSTITVDASTLSRDDGEELKELLGYLSSRLSVAPTQSGSQLTITASEEKEVRAREVREQVKRFLYRRGLKSKYRVTASGRAVTLRRIGKP